MILRFEIRCFQKKDPPQNKRGEVTNFRKNQFVGEYHLSFNIAEFRLSGE